MITMTAGENVHIAVDADGGPSEGSATLVITELQP